AMSFKDADFWFACDEQGANEQLKHGLPLLGSIAQPLKNVQGFALGMGLEQPGAAQGDVGLLVVAGISLNQEAEAETTEKVLEGTCTTASRRIAQRTAKSKPATAALAADEAGQQDDGKGKSRKPAKKTQQKKAAQNDDDSGAAEEPDVRLRPIMPP